MPKSRYRRSAEDLQLWSDPWIADAHQSCRRYELIARLIEIQHDTLIGMFPLACWRAVLHLRDCPTSLGDQGKMQS